MSNAQDYILVVDDDPSIRELVTFQLDFLEFTTRATGDPEEALDLVRSEDGPAVVLLDIEMPNASGLEILKKIKQTDVREVQVIMVSGLQDIGTVRQCLQAGAYDYLAKPFELEDLHNTTERAFERRELRLDNRRYHENLERMVGEQTDEI
ncbi:MAG: response regulator, partial [Acidobacteriota bacterium]